MSTMVLVDTSVWIAVFSKSPTIRMAWQDVLVLADREFFYANGGRVGAETCAYSLHERLVIGELIIGYAELLAIVRANITPIELPPSPR